MMFFYLMLLLFGSNSYATSCQPPLFRVWSQGEISCSLSLAAAIEEGESCLPQIFPQLAHFQAIINQGSLPWWVSAGNELYPNLAYPGVWKNKQIDASFYPGEGEIFAAKPNIYIQSIHPQQRMSLKFSGAGAKHFLATTPMLNENFSWEGKIREGEKFEIEGVYYDYLFYDVRLPKSAMQFTHGLCTTRLESISWMKSDLELMNFPGIALSDFEEHWKVKIPDYPYFCIYPQYNQQLDATLPIELTIEQASLTRSLYVLVAYEEIPETDATPAIPFPTQDPQQLRPSTQITRENMFKEWGVAFLGE